MTIQLTTSGGFTGRGAGSVKVDGRSATIDNRLTVELTAAESASLANLPELRAARRGASATPDAITYTLTIDGKSWSWSDAEPPGHCQRWAAALLAIRDRALGQPSSSM